jgi:hypothetical protein
LDATGLGWIAHTSIPKGWHSMCNEAASWLTKALVDAYIAANGVGMLAAMLLVNTTHPFFFCETSSLMKWCATWMPDVALHS